MIDQESSLRIDLLRFPLVVGIVFLHAYWPTVGLAGGVTIGVSQTGPVADFVRNLVSQGLARTAVPVFFMISGYLFFTGLDWSMDGYLTKLKTRVRTLLIPFLFWNTAWLLFLALAQAVPASRVFFSGSNMPIADYGAFDYISAVFGIGRLPVAYQFWFIRDLMLLVLLAPLIGYTVRRVAWPFLVVVSMCWLLGVWPVYAPSAEATLFFALGGFFASSGTSLFAFDRYGPIAVAVYLPIVVADALLIGHPVQPYLHQLGVAIGVAAVLFLTRLVAASTNLKHTIISLSGASFFVFATHELLLSIARKVAYAALSPDSSGLVLVLYFLVPTVLIVLLVMTYRLLLRRTPRFLSVITGGRNTTTRQVVAAGR